MASKSLTLIQKAINDDFKRLDESFEVPTPAHYEEFDDFKELVKLKDGTLDDFLGFEYESKLRAMIETSPHIDETLHQEMTAHIFGLPLSSRALLRNISDSQYLYPASLHDDKLNMQNSAINRKLTSWIGYCQLVNNTVEYIKTSQPRWSKMTTKDKKAYIESLEHLISAPFINKGLLELSIDFLKNYRLNQETLAKANFLCNLNLPKITSLKIAQEIIKKTSLPI